MAKPGRIPKSEVLKRLEGNRGHRSGGEGVKIKTKMPACPEHLDPIARAEWKRVTPRLFAFGLLDVLDHAAIEAYCSNYSIYVQISKYIKEQGGVAKYLIGKSAQTGVHLMRMDKAMAHIKAFCIEFGLTPNSRGRMDLTVPDTKPGEFD